MLISSSIVFRDIRYYLNLSVLLQVSWRMPFALLLLVFHIVHRVQNAICRIDYKININNQMKYKHLRKINNIDLGILSEMYKAVEYKPIF